MSLARPIVFENRPDVGQKAAFQSGDNLQLSKDNHHHIRNVLRLKDGDTCMICDSTGETFWVASLEFSVDGAKATLLEKATTGYTSSPVEHLILALCKGKKNDLVIEKATELGVRKISIVRTKHSIAKVSKKDQTGKLERWLRVAEAAAKQSQKPFIPQVAFFESLADLVNEVDSKRSHYIFSLRKNATPIREIPAREAGEFCSCAVGPEGDFSEEEYELFFQNGFHELSLGPYRLRSETAAITGIAALQARLGF